LVALIYPALQVENKPKSCFGCNSLPQPDQSNQSNPVQPQSNFWRGQSNLVQLEVMDIGAGGLRGSMSAWKETWEETWEKWEGFCESDVGLCLLAAACIFARE
jgi:hypothetical protein